VWNNRSLKHIRFPRLPHEQHRMLLPTMSPAAAGTRQQATPLQQRNSCSARRDGMGSMLLLLERLVSFRFHLKVILLFLSADHLSTRSDITINITIKIINIILIITTAATTTHLKRFQYPAKQAATARPMSTLVPASCWEGEMRGRSVAGTTCSSGMSRTFLSSASGSEHQARKVETSWTRERGGGISQGLL